MLSSPPRTVICTYRVKARSEDAFLEHLACHWPTLHRLGLVTDKPSQIFFGADPFGKPFFIEVFTWHSAEAPFLAHDMPEVVDIWESMETLVEERDGLPAIEFPQVFPFMHELAGY